MDTKTNTMRIFVPNGKTLNTLLKSHAIKWKGWMLCVDEWDNGELPGSGESNLQAFFAHRSVWNENMTYDDAGRWDIEEGDPLYGKTGVIERDDYWLLTGTVNPSVKQLIDALKDYVGDEPEVSTEVDFRERVLSFRVTFHELDILKRKAKEQGKTVSCIIREAINMEVKLIAP